MLSFNVKFIYWNFWYLNILVVFYLNDLCFVNGSFILELIKYREELIDNKVIIKWVVGKINGKNDV